MSNKLLSLAHEIVSGGVVECLFCGSKGAVEMHHWHGRARTKEVGSINDGLLTGIVPLCHDCHALDYRGEKFLAKIKHSLAEGDIKMQNRLVELALCAMGQSYLNMHRRR